MGIAVPVGEAGSRSSYGRPLVLFLVEGVGQWRCMYMRNGPPPCHRKPIRNRFSPSPGSVRRAGPCSDCGSGCDRPRMETDERHPHGFADVAAVDHRSDEDGPQQTGLGFAVAVCSSSEGIKSARCPGRCLGRGVRR